MSYKKSMEFIINFNIQRDIHLHGCPELVIIFEYRDPRTLKYPPCISVDDKTGFVKGIQKYGVCCLFSATMDSKKIFTQLDPALLLCGLNGVTIRLEPFCEFF